MQRTHPISKASRCAILKMDSPRLAATLGRASFGLFLLAALGALGTPLAASTQLSDDGLPFSDVSFTTTLPTISPNGQYAVYRHDSVIDGAIDLWSVRLDGVGSPVRLSQPLTPTSGQFLTFAISPNSAWVVYSVDQEDDGKLELYSVAIGGGPIKKLNPNLLDDRDVSGFAISATSDYVVYGCDRTRWTKYEVYSVEIDGPGSLSVRLNTDIGADDDVEGFVISPDGQTVVYRAGNTDSDEWDLYSVSILGGEAVKISLALPNGSGVLQYFRISPDGNKVVYLADPVVDGSFQLYSVPIDDGTSILLNGPLVSGGSVEPNFLFSPNSSRVVYRADQVVNESFELYSVPTGGGTATRLNGGLAINEDVETNFFISANGSRVVYRSDEAVTDVVDAYSVPIAGGTPTKLNPTPVGGGDVLDLAVSADSSRVVYLADQTVDTLNELFSVPLGGGTAVRLNRQLAPSGDVQVFRISPNSDWVVYGADQDTDQVDELLAAPIAGGTVVDVSSPLPSGGDVVLKIVQTLAFDISPTNGLDILYGADQTTDGKVDLFVSSLGGPPSAPTSVVAVAGNGQVTVTFAAPASNGGSPITGYTVTPSPATVGWVDSNAGSTSLTHVITNLTNGTAYTFSVRATNVNGIGDPSAPSNSATPATVPSAPSGAAAVPRNFSADVTFTGSVNNGGSAITGYVVVSNPAGGVDLNGGTTGLQHRVVGLVNGTPYTFTVVAQNAMGSSPASSPTSAVTPGCSNVVSTNVFCDGLESNDTTNWSAALTPPSAPVSAAAVAGTGQASVTFLAPLDSGGSPISGYTVTSDPAGGVDSNAGTPGLAHIVTGLTAGTPYTFTVRAANASGQGPASLPSNSVTPFTVPGQATGLVAVAGDQTATLTFLAPANDGGSPILGYTVISDPPGGLDSDVGTTLLSHLITNLSNGTAYTFTVVATNAVGPGSASKSSNSVTPQP